MSELPEGYVIASVARYPEVMTDRKSGRTYTVAVQLLNQQTADMPRGVGMSVADATAHAVTNAGGDDGLSALFRKMLGPQEGNA